MAKTNFQTADDYISSLPKEPQDILNKVRKTIQQAVPEAEEVISYQIPAFRYHGWIFYYAAYTHHYALSCPPPFTVFATFAEELAPYKITKSSIKFPLDKPVPVSLIAAMAKHRAKENLESSAAKKAKKK